MVTESEIAKEYVPRFKYILKDISTVKDSEIIGNINLRLYFTIKKYINLPDFKKYFTKMIPLFIELSRKQTGMEYLVTILRYIYDVREDIDPEEIEIKLINALNEDKKEEIMTVAERLRKEGEIKGKIKTYKELLAKGLLAKEMVEQKLAELNRKLEEITAQSQKAV